MAKDAEYARTTDIMNNLDTIDNFYTSLLPSNGKKYLKILEKLNKI